MAARGRGGGKTPERVVTLLQKEVSKSSQAATARATGLTLQTVQRYIQGVGEPSQATLEKIASYFYVSVAWLRGGTVGPLERLLEGLKETGVDTAIYNRTVAEKMGKECDYWGELVAGNALLNSEHPEVLCNFSGINQYWVTNGKEPPLLFSGGFVGSVTENIGVPESWLQWEENYTHAELDEYMKMSVQDKRKYEKELHEKLEFTRKPSKEEEEYIEVVSTAFKYPNLFAEYLKTDVADRSNIIKMLLVQEHQASTTNDSPNSKKN